jgi:predicted house-cleaning noncanonical NTP pyrophosphatase (MazG superfamily)
MSDADYSQMTKDEFEAILEDLVGRMSATEILAVGNVAAELREHLNNEVLEVWDDADYSQMTEDEFDAILEDLVSKMPASQLLSYGDVNMCLREHLNNEVLEVWERKHPDKLSK